MHLLEYLIHDFIIVSNRIALQSGVGQKPKHLATLSEFSISIYVILYSNDRWYIGYYADFSHETSQCLCEVSATPGFRDDPELYMDDHANDADVETLFKYILSYGQEQGWI